MEEKNIEEAERETLIDAVHFLESSLNYDALKLEKNFKGLEGQLLDIETTLESICEILERIVSILEKKNDDKNVLTLRVQTEPLVVDGSNEKDGGDPSDGPFFVQEPLDIDGFADYPDVDCN